MKRAKRLVHTTLKPRNPLAADPLLGKGGAHQRTDKRARRARQKQELLRQFKQE
jgi:hypothetical protein